MDLALNNLQRLICHKTNQTIFFTLLFFTFRNKKKKLIIFLHISVVVSSFSVYNNCFSNDYNRNLIFSSLLSESPGVSEPIYEDIGSVHLDKCTADSPGDKCCCVSPDSIHKTDAQVLNMQQHSKVSHDELHFSVHQTPIFIACMV